MAIDLGQFKLTKATLEIRYAPAFLVWDRAGAVWNDVSKRFPNLSVDKAAPQKVEVTINENCQAVVGIDAAYCIIAPPKSDLSDLREIAQTVFNSVIARLEISALTRIGFRPIYSQDFKGRKEASESLLSQMSLKAPTGKLMNVEGSVVDLERTVRVESEDFGFKVTAKSQHVTLTLPLPGEFRDLAPRKTERFQAVVDIDYYSIGSTPTAAFDASALIESWLHLVRRDISKVF